LSNVFSPIAVGARGSYKPPVEGIDYSMLHLVDRTGERIIDLAADFARGGADGKTSVSEPTPSVPTDRYREHWRAE